MPLYQISSNALCPLVSTTFQEENLWEKRDLQRLLKENIAAIAPDVLVIAEEFGAWSESGRRIDLLAIDKDANLVVIELKRTNDGGHMELQAIRYAAMVANMTWEQAKSAFKKYLVDDSMDDVETRICEFLDWDAPREDDFAQKVRIVLASENFSKEITTSVLWLNEHDLDVSCVRLSLHKIGDELVLSADQIIPLPEAKSYQIEVRQKRREEQVSRSSKKDRSLFTISYANTVYERDFKKSDIALFSVKLLEDKSLITQTVFDFLKDDRSCGHTLLKRLEDITEVERANSKYRFNGKPELMFGDQGYYVARSWGINHARQFIKKMEAEFPDLSYSSISPD